MGADPAKENIILITPSDSKVIYGMSLATNYNDENTIGGAKIDTHLLINVSFFNAFSSDLNYTGRTIIKHDRTIALGVNGFRLYD